MVDSPSDRILLELLKAGNKERESCLSELISMHAEPVIKKIVYYRLNVSSGHSNTKESWDAADVCGSALTQVLSQVSKFSENPEKYPIRDFRAYTAVVAHHACNQYFRQKFPKRTQLSNRLRYLMNHKDQFALWTIDDRLVCGFQRFRESSPIIPTQETINTNKISLKTTADMSPAKLSALLINLFEILKAPLYFDDLIKLMIDLLGIHELRQVEESATDKESILERIEDQRTDTSTEIEQRHYLKKLWGEMIILPLRQRTALFLSIRDEEGGSVLHLFPVTRIASIHAVAECLLISPEDFASIWDKLPLEDNEIASRMGITRQQVINLRRSARERLARRMKPF